MSSYTFSAVLPEPIDEVRPRVELALRNEGFGVLTEIDVAATLKAKLDLDRGPYLIPRRVQPPPRRACARDRSFDWRAPALQCRPPSG